MWGYWRTSSRDFVIVQRCLKWLFRPVLQCQRQRDQNLRHNVPETWWLHRYSPWQNPRKYSVRPQWSGLWSCKSRREFETHWHVSNYGPRNGRWQSHNTVQTMHLALRTAPSIRNASNHPVPCSTTRTGLNSITKQKPLWKWIAIIFYKHSEFDASKG